VTLEEVASHAAGDLVGRPHMARALVDRGAVDSVQEAFDEYLGEGARAYLPKKRVTSREAVDLLHGAGGVAVVAHPVTVGDPDAVAGILDDLDEVGLDGLEVVHNRHGPDERTRFLEMARARDLVPTGGSDFHGENKPNVDLATGREDNVDVRSSTLEALRERAQRYR
jgi:predicted metal-dependent phosphoesterase TrpH